ncbi:MAG: DUF3553 domain-containing protein [Kofleriaceae bacterium]
MHRIEAAKSGRARCAVCDAAIARGAVRIAEWTQPPPRGPLRKPFYRYHHLDCAVMSIPEIVWAALHDPYAADDVPVDRAALEVRLTEILAEHRERRRTRYAEQVAVVAPSEPALDEAIAPELLAQLLAQPDDLGVLEVVADALQSRGDPRGELIAMQLALRAGAADPSPLIKRRDELMLRLSPVLEPGERCGWGTGFVTRVELQVKSPARLSSMAALWREPILSIVREVKLSLATAYNGRAVAAALAPVAAQLRRFELEASYRLPSAVCELVGALPRLEHLGLTELADLGRLAHPALASLELSCEDRAAPESFAELSPRELPGVVRLVVRRTHVWTDELCARLSAGGWLSRLTHLAITHGTLSAAGVEVLAAGLAGRKLAQLDVSHHRLPFTLRGALAALCDELVFPDPVEPSGVVWVEHANKPEWGRGTLVRRYDGKVEVSFPAAGVKVFRADAPFLRLGGS